ncbi:MAG: hypothetical protein LKH93_07000 [Clostridium beijerinckii]|nr:hypothetical protein [Clostridium beijerinckii]MCI1578562.1 hypothetical protein [Clostridium beijerinckii]MCI1582106.1 hypothetical protein [Clostridium beijerinckii]MCI1621956.1 hypothetical protein [Clostridium beijerinckii]
MGNLIKITMYAEYKRKRKNRLNLKTVEEIISKYDIWLKETKREDKIENYEEFLQAR